MSEQTGEREKKKLELNVDELQIKSERSQSFYLHLSVEIIITSKKFLLWKTRTSSKMPPKHQKYNHYMYESVL